MAALHAANRSHQRLHWLCCTAGTSLFPTLMGVPGSTSTVNAGFVPYAVEESRLFLGGRRPRSVCSAATASAVAEAARIRGTQTQLARLGNHDMPRCELATGVASQAVLATSRSHKGELRAFISVADIFSEWQLRVRFASEGSDVLGRDAQDESVGL